jgi:ribosomal protein S18 acetylase RimI-like enzyme
VRAPAIGGLAAPEQASLTSSDRRDSLTGMSDASPPAIRPYRRGDDTALMRVCLETGAAGKDATGMLEEPDLLSHVFLLPYLALEPDLASVVAPGDGPAVGYVLGALDSRSFEATCEARIWPALRERFPLDLFPSDTFEGVLVHLIHHPPLADDEVVAEYPSHLHIDLLPTVQRGGFGRRLIDRLLAQLTERGSTGVHLGTSERNMNAIAFYRHLGFEQHGRTGHGEVTFVRRLPGR